MFHFSSKRSSRTRCLGLEKLEDRRLLAAVAVTTIPDVVDGDVDDGLLGPTGLIANPGLD